MHTRVHAFWRPASAYGCEDSVGRALSVSMDSESEVIDEKAGTSLVIPQSVQRAAGDVVHQAFERLVSSDLHVTTATEGKRLLAEDDNTEQRTDAIQRFVGIATPVVRIALRGARFTRIPWVLVASTSVSIGVTVRTGVRELQVLAALLAHRFEEETGAQPDTALLRKLTLELYLRPRRAPNVSDVSLPLARLARRWMVVARWVGTRVERRIRRLTPQSVSTWRRWRPDPRGTVSGTRPLLVRASRSTGSSRAPSRRRDFLNQGARRPRVDAGFSSRSTAHRQETCLHRRAARCALTPVNRVASAPHTLLAATVVATVWKGVVRNRTATTGVIPTSNPTRACDGPVLPAGIGD